jgi:cysteinyl-tRNA synthetase
LNLQKLVQEREKAIKNKDWATSDKLRVKINKLRFVIDDTKEGTKIKKN